MLILIVLGLADVSLFEDTEFLADMLQGFQRERICGGCLFVCWTNGQGFSDRTDDGAAATIMRIRIVAHTVAGNEKSLILDGTGSRQDLPRILAAFRPVGHADDRIVLQAVGITAPDGESHIVAREQQHPEAFILHDGVPCSRLIITVLMTITEQVAFIIMLFDPISAVDEIMAVAVVMSFRIRIIIHVDGQAARDGATTFPGRATHPIKGY